MKTKEELLEQFKGMTDQQSIDHQLKYWIEGIALHNPVRDECCPDFSCCTGNIMSKDIRLRFKQAINENDEKTKNEILMMGLSMMLASSEQEIDVYLAGENAVKH